MGSIRELKSDIQIIEVRRDDLVGKISDQAVAQGVLNIIKDKHQHQDGSPVNLRVVSQTGGPSLADAAFRTHLDQPKSPRADSPSAHAEPFGKSGIDSLASTLAAQSGSAPRQSVSVGSSAYSGNSSGGGGTDAYKAGSAISGFNIQCNCGMEFTGTASKDHNTMVTGSKYNAGNDSAAPTYNANAGGDWESSAYQTGGIDMGDSAYQSGNDAYKG